MPTCPVAKHAAPLRFCRGTCSWTPGCEGNGTDCRIRSALPRLSPCRREALPPSSIHCPRNSAQVKTISCPLRQRNKMTPLLPRVIRRGCCQRRSAQDPTCEMHVAFIPFNLGTYVSDNTVFAQKNRLTTPVIDLTGPSAAPISRKAPEPGAARRQQFIRVLGDGGNSQAAALK